jgi:hypothetical protein
LDNNLLGKEKTIKRTKYLFIDPIGFLDKKLLVNKPPFILSP